MIAAATNLVLYDWLAAQPRVLLQLGQHESGHISPRDFSYTAYRAVIGCTPLAARRIARQTTYAHDNPLKAGGCLVLDGVYRSSEGEPVFHEVRAPSIDELQTLLGRIIQRILKLLTRTGYLIEEQGMTYWPKPSRIARSRPCKWRRAPIALRWGHTQAKKC